MDAKRPWTSMQALQEADPSTDAHGHLERGQITRILAENPVDGHLFQMQANYIVRQKCGVRALTNAAREKIQSMHESPCWYGPWTPGPHWGGNPSHSMWRKGAKVYCQHCKCFAINKAEGWHASRMLQKPCAADATRQTQLPICFKAKSRPEGDGDC